MEFDASQPKQVGDVVHTSYGAGPYLVLRIDGPCACPEYLRWINGDNSPSEPHYHLTCHSETTNAGRPGRAWLNEYRLDGSSVWGDHRLEVVGGRGSTRPNEQQPDLFGSGLGGDR